ncbi:YolD-like family protein [Gracilibacillus boraciitolerans]|nr:YolD-like family protein [Gracilibacillus boraciitolerans]
MVNDRGNKKWTALMLPEHVEILRSLDEMEKDMEKPILSVDQLEEMETTLNEALENSLPVTIKYHKNKRIHQVTGSIKTPKNGKITIVTSDDILFINIGEIIGVNTL